MTKFILFIFLSLATFYVQAEPLDASGLENTQTDRSRALPYDCVRGLMGPATGLQRLTRLGGRLQDQMRTIVGLATPNDFDDIIAIQTIHLRNENTNPREGFVITATTPAYLQKIVDEGGYIFVARVNDEVVGYSIVLSPTQRQRLDWLTPSLPDAWLEPDIANRIWYYKQTAVLPTASRFIPVQLAMAVAELVDSQNGRYLLGLVAHNPPNLRSLQFHESMGGQILGIIEDDTPGMLWALFVFEFED